MADRNNSYTNKYKLEAIALAVHLGSNRKAAAQLGINEKNIRTWRKNETAIRDAPRQQRIALPRRRAQWPELDVQVCAYVDKRRENALGVSRALIRTEDLRVVNRLKITGFIASEGWCTRFMRRNNYSLRGPTKIAQKLPKHYVNKIVEFQRFVIRHRRRCNYQLACIGNMDETPVYMDMLPRNTVNKKGEKQVIMKSTGHEKSRYTVVLAVMADGTKLPPMIIFKRKTKPPGNYKNCDKN